MRAFLLLFGAALLSSNLVAASRPLQIFVIDVEGGQATLFVTPSGKSLLVDTGWSYHAFRDANRIVAAAKLAKIKKLDAVLITHFHTDHVGGVPQLVSKLPVDTFYDHGPNRETSKESATLYSEYQSAIAGAHHVVVKPGDKLPIAGLDATVVSADGELIPNALPGAGQPNPACSDVQQQAADPSENARSAGLVLAYNQFRIVDLGDLTWQKELSLMCPGNKLGRADLLIVSHHGSALSSSPALVHALQPRVAVFDNGSHKGADASAWDIVKSAPGLQDIWQLHFADAGGSAHNTSDPFIANVNEADTGYYLKLTVEPDGSLNVFNPRNKFSKSYPAAR